MAMNIINYKGLHKRKNYEQLLDYLQNNQDMIRYPDRFANQMRNHPYLTQFDSDEFGLMQDQQKEIKKQEVIKDTMLDEATQTNGVSTTDLLARAPLRPPPMGFGSHLDTSGGGLNSVRPRGFGVDPPDFGSLVSDFIQDVVDRNDEQRSSVSGGSFAETPSFLKPVATPIISSNLMKQLEQSKNDKINEEIERNAMYLQDVGSKKLRDNYKKRDADMDLVKSIEGKTQTDPRKVIDLFEELDEIQKQNSDIKTGKLIKFFKQYDVVNLTQFMTDTKEIDISEVRQIFKQYIKIVENEGKDPFDYTGKETLLISSGKKDKSVTDKTTTLTKDYMLRTLKKYWIQVNMNRGVKKSTASSSSGAR
jgi:hypothetical protein